MPDIVKDDNQIVDSLIKLLPEREVYSKEHRMTAAFYLWSDIRELIFQELVKDIDGDNGSQTALRQSTDVIKALGLPNGDSQNGTATVALPPEMAKKFGRDKVL